LRCELLNGKAYTQRVTHLHCQLSSTRTY